MVTSKEGQMEVMRVKYFYERTSCVVDGEEDMEYTTYGVRALDQNQNVAAAYPDVSTRADFVQNIVDLCNQNEADVLHLEDILTDSIG